MSFIRISFNILPDREIIYIEEESTEMMAYGLSRLTGTAPGQYEVRLPSEAVCDNSLFAALRLAVGDEEAVIVSIPTIAYPRYCAAISGQCFAAMQL